MITSPEEGMAEMIRAVPNSWFSNSFTIFDRDGTPVGRVDLSKRPWCESTKLEVGGTRYEARGKRGSGKEFILQTEDGRVVVVVEQPSAWRNRFVARATVTTVPLPHKGWIAARIRRAL